MKRSGKLRFPTIASRPDDDRQNNRTIISIIISSTNLLYNDYENVVQEKIRKIENIKKQLMRL